MRLQLNNNRVQQKNKRIHGGMMDVKKHSQNVKNLTKSFAGLLGSKKNTKFVLKL